MKSLKEIEKSAAYIRERCKKIPEILLILGSGLGVLAEELREKVVIPYGDIPNFPKSTAPGHAGELVIGELSGKSVAVMNGRFHYYEGYDMEAITLPVQVMSLLGVKNLLVTNAAGGINLDYKPGDLMVISDHIKLFAENPLRGVNDEKIGPRFPDMSRAYTPFLRELAHRAAGRKGLTLKEGVYAMMSGPCYETPAEIRALRTLGADAVGMSTVPEVIAAAHGGMRVLGISCISNMAAGILDQSLTHQEVLDTAEKIRESFIGLVKEIITIWE